MCRLEFDRDLVNPDCSGTHQLNAKLYLIPIHKYRSTDFVSSPFAGIHRMVPHVIPERSGAIFPVNPDKQPPDTPETRVNPYQSSIDERLAKEGRSVEVLIKKANRNGGRRSDPQRVHRRAPWAAMTLISRCSKALAGGSLTIEICRDASQPILVKKSYALRRRCLAALVVVLVVDAGGGEGR